MPSLSDMNNALIAGRNAKNSAYFGLEQTKNNSFADQLAKLTRDQYLKNKPASDARINDLINSATSGTDIIDEARESSVVNNKLSEDVQKRNSERYGVKLNPAIMNQRITNQTNSNTLNSINSANNAELTQVEVNADRLKRAASAVDSSYSQGISALQNASNMEEARRSAYKNAKASRKQSYLSAGISALGFMAGL
jgi:hypothetical protein